MNNYSNENQEPDYMNIDYTEKSNETPNERVERLILNEVHRQYVAIVMQGLGKDSLTKEDYKDSKLEEIEDGSYLVHHMDQVVAIITIETLSSGITINTTVLTTED